MKHLSYIALSVCVLCSVLCAPIQAQDYARLSERTILGTARYMGMAGAMTAIGGDASAVIDNPAGLGLYRRWESTITFGAAVSDPNNNIPIGKSRSSFLFSQLSLVCSLPTEKYYGGSGVILNNLMFSYQRLHSFRHTYNAEADGGTSLGYLMSDKGVNMDIPYCNDPSNTYNNLLVQEAGYVDQYSFHWAMNYSDKFYVGAGLHIQSYQLSSDAVYYERFGKAGVQGVYANENDSYLGLTGTGFNMSLGLLYRPMRWLRLGASVQLPTVGWLNTYTRGTFKAQTDSLRYSYAPDLGFQDKNFHMPWKLSTSVAFQIGGYALLALQYDYSHANYRNDWHSLRAGFEVVPVLGFYINGGYAFEMEGRGGTLPAAMDPTFDRQDTYSIIPHRAQYASLALGYRGTYVIVQMAYQYHWNRPVLYAHEYATQYSNISADTHRIVLTLGWHSN